MEKLSLPELRFLDYIVSNQANVSAIACGIEQTLQDKIQEHYNTISVETKATLKNKQRLREQALAGYYKYLDSLMEGDLHTMGPIETFHLKAVHDLVWGYMANYIIVYSENGMGLFMSELIGVITGTARLDHLFDVANAYGIADGKTIVGYINQGISQDSPINRVLEKMRTVGLIDSKNKTLKPLNLVSKLCKQFAGDEGIKNWAKVFSPFLGKTASNLTSSAEKCMSVEEATAITQALNSLSNLSNSKKG